MKRTRLIAFIALALAMLMALSSCGMRGAKTVPLSKLLDDEARYPDSKKPATYAAAQKLADLTNATVAATNEELVYLTSTAEVGTNEYERHIVYNVETNQIVYTGTESATGSIAVLIVRCDGDNEEDTYVYFVVKTSTWTEENPQDISVKTSLYDAKGTSFASAEADKNGEFIYDMIYFNGACYRAAEDGAISKAFDYSPLAYRPNIMLKVGEYYVETVDEGASYISGVKAYDAELNLVSSYSFPSYADVGTCLAGLDSSRLLVQYAYELEEDAEKYDFIEDGYIRLAKYDLCTMIVNLEKGTAKEIECNYCIDFAFSTDTISKEYLTESGMDLGKYAAYGAARKIENKRLVNDFGGKSFEILIDKSGKVVEMDRINGLPIDAAEVLDAGVWSVVAGDMIYLVDKKGEILADVSNATVYGQMLCADGKIYNPSLNLLYDFESNKQSLYSGEQMDAVVLLQDTAGNVFLYNGVGNPVQIASAKDGQRVTTVGDCFVTVVNTDDATYTVYNNAGQVLQTFDSALVELMTVAELDNATLISVYNPLTMDTEFFRLG